MKFIEIIQQIKSALGDFGGVKWSFGEPQVLGESTIITVAKVSMGLGGGGGSSASSPTKDPAEGTETESKGSNEGGGGGGGIKTEPVGIYLIREDKVKFYPVISFKEIAAIFGILSVLLFRLIRMRYKK